MTSHGFRQYDASDAAPRGYAWLTDVALLLAVTLVLCRATMVEFLRSPFAVGVIAGGAREPGPTTSVVLDCLCWLPAFLVLTRRACDGRYLLSPVRSGWAAAALAGWVAASVAWSSDAFSAAVGASTWAAAGATCWAVSQCVRDAARLRWVAGGLAGLLLIFITHSAIYHYLDHPETLADWLQRRDAFFAEQGWDPTSMIARQFDQKVKAGELVGFTLSSNSFAAVVALTLWATLGAAAQCWRAGVRGGAVGLACVGGLGAVLLFAGSSRTAQAGFVLCAVLGAVIYANRGRLRRHARPAFWAGVMLALAGAAGVVAYGRATGGLVHVSLTFRWNYWLASYDLFKAHALRGVGWTNFGPSYLRYRLPQAAEEVRDPHNFFVRFATETGAIGFALALAWVLWTAWEITQRRDEPLAERRETHARPAALVVAALGLLWLIASGAAVIDPQSGGAAYETIKRCFYAVLLATGVATTLVRRTEPSTEDGPAPLLAFALAVGAAGFLLHSMVDFAFFDTGPLFVMLLVTGASVGINRAAPEAPADTRRGAARAGLAAGCAAVALVVVLFVVPIARAEAAAVRGDVLIAAARSAARDAAASRRDATAAASLFRQAFDVCPVRNADYALREAEALITAGADALPAYDRAVAADPLRGKARLDRARLLLRVAPDRHAAIEADYETALEMNPNDLYSRYEYADTLAAAGQAERARAQYRRVLQTNDAFIPDEPKRLSPEKLADVTAKAQ